ncbi:protein of unknown function [Paraburkholderia kururiensis]
MDSNSVPMATILPPASRGERRGCFRLYAERAGNIVTVRVAVWRVTQSLYLPRFPR